MFEEYTGIVVATTAGAWTCSAVAKPAVAKPAVSSRKSLGMKKTKHPTTKPMRKLPGSGDDGKVWHLVKYIEYSTKEGATTKKKQKKMDIDYWWHDLMNDVYESDASGIGGAEAGAFRWRFA